LNFGLVFVGLVNAPATISGIVNQLWTPFTLLIAWPLLGERPSLRVLLGVATAICGVALAVVDPSESVPVGSTFLIGGSAFALAMGNVLAKRYGPFNPIKLMGWMSFFTVPQVLLASFLLENGQIAVLQAADISAWLAFTYTVLLGGIIAFGLWFWLIARCSMSRVTPFALLQAPFAIAAGVIFRHEPLTPSLVAGAIICILGVAITQPLSLPSFVRRAL
jgi:O-acetylserine/cysteine efflux transporter